MCSQRQNSLLITGPCSAAELQVWGSFSELTPEHPAPALAQVCSRDGPPVWLCHVAKWPVSRWGLSSRARRERVAEPRGMRSFHVTGLRPTEVPAGTEDPVRPAPDVPGCGGGGPVHPRVPGTCGCLTWASPPCVQVPAWCVCSMCLRDGCM